jgi:3D-(3,5/4)-trihydroxycyclohexane-1,2-dione acylhydrolase (decyclizing)
MSAVATPSSSIESNTEDTTGVIRLTAAQALVRFLQRQYTERDGLRVRLIPAMFGIFGHGNVTSIGQALFEDGADLPYFQPGLACAWLSRTERYTCSLGMART